MGKIIDLGILVKEPLIFRLATGEEYIIPGEISTKFVVQLSKYGQQIQGLTEDDKAYEIMQKMVADILSQDKSKTITLEFVKERFDDVRYLKAIVNGMMEHIKDIAADPN